MIDLPAPVSPVSTLKPGRQLYFELFYCGEVGDTKESEHGYVRNSTLPSSALWSTQIDGHILRSCKSSVQMWRAIELRFHRIMG